MVTTKVRHGEPVQAAGLHALEAARGLPCSLCYAPAGAPCRSDPDRDHLGRYCEAEANGKITRPQLAVIVDGLAVIAVRLLVEAAAR